MVSDDEYTQRLRAALAVALEENYNLERRLAASEAEKQRLVEIGQKTGFLTDGHAPMLDRLARQATDAVRPPFRLRLYVEDKYQLTGPDIDCIARLPVCRARCCSLDFELTPQDVEENRVRWNPERPFTIHHDDDGFCEHLDRVNNTGCTVYGHRPATCRSYSCAYDARIWTDFEKMIPAPWPPTLAKRRKPGTGTGSDSDSDSDSDSGSGSGSGPDSDSD